MTNKEKVNKLMHELQNTINAAYVWKEVNDEEEFLKSCKRIDEIRQKVLDIVID